MILDKSQVASVLDEKKSDQKAPQRQHAPDDKLQDLNFRTSNKIN